jgi:membrane-associated phospholipid phosphatase
MGQKKTGEAEGNGIIIKSAWENPWFMMPSLAFLAIGLAVSLRLPYGEEIIRLNALRQEPWNTLFALVTHLGEVIAFVAAGLLALFFRYRITILVLIVGLLTIPVSYYLKDTIGHDRPITYFEKSGDRDKVVLVPDVRLNGGQTSFPSGHSMAAFALYATLAAAAGRKRPVLSFTFTIAAVATCFSRIFLVQHFLNDVIAGAIIGLVLSWITVTINNRLLPARWEKLDKGIFSD